MEWETRLVQAQGFAPDGKQYYYVEGLYPSFENVLSSGSAEDRTVYYLVERDGNSVKFYALSAVTEQRVDHKEKFNGTYLMIENGAVEMHNGYYRDARTKGNALLAKNAHYLDNVRIEANGTDFTFDNFLGTNLTVTVKRENGVLGYYVNGQKLSVSETVYGVTVTDPTSPLYHIFWNAAYVTQAQSQVEVTGTNITLDANFANNTFGITQIRHVTWRPHYAWTNRTFQAMQKSVVVQYYKLEEVSASISNESQYSGVRFTAPDPNDSQKTVYFYEFKDKNGNTYYVDGLDGNAKRVNVEQKEVKHQEALDYSKLLLDGKEVKYGTDTGVACFANKQPDMEINNVKYYRLGMMDEDGKIVYHPYKFQEPILENGQDTGKKDDVEYILYVAVSGNQVSIVKEKQRPDIAPEKGADEGYWQDNGGTRYEKGNQTTATISVVEKQNDGTEKTVSVQGSFEAFTKGQSIPYYRKTTVENNTTVYTFYKQTGTDTNGTALYALCTDTPINWVLTGNVFLNYKPEGDSGSTTQPLTQRDGTNERYLLVDEKAFDNWQKDKRLELYYTDGNLCQEYEILCKWEGRKKTYQLVYAAGQQYGIVESGYTQEAQYKEWTETYHEATFTASSKSVRFDMNSRENFIDPTRHSLDQNSQVLVLRFGSKGNTITFTGKIADIGLNTTKLPTNAVVNGSDAYKVTESMYLTKSGLIVNIKGDFASKFDGKVYTSTKLIAEELGKLAVSKNLTGVNENGETIYQTIAEHLTGTAALCREFAADFGAEADGDLMGLAHDLGKCTDAFQKRLLEGGPVVDHTTAGMLTCIKMKRPSAAACVAVHLGHKHTVDAESLVKGLCDRYGVLTGHRVNDEDDLGRLDRGLDVFQLVHQLFVDVQAACGIEKHDVVAVVAGIFDGFLRNGDRIDLTHLENGDIQLLSDDLQLCDGRGTVHVARGEQRTVALLAEVARELGDVRRLTGALQAHHHHNGGALGRGGQTGVGAAHQRR